MKRVKILTAGESHGKQLTGIIDGVPSGLELSHDDFKTDMNRRRSGIGRSERMLIEEDSVEIFSGVRNGLTTGAPIALIIKNEAFDRWKDTLSIEQGSESVPVTIPRPGHADYAGAVKYDHKDIRNIIERASARETAIKTAIGVIAKKFLFEFDIDIFSRPLLISDIQFEYSKLLPCTSDLKNGLDSIKKEADKIYGNKQKQLQDLKTKLKELGDTCGGEFQVIANKMPVGLGSYSQSDQRMDAILAYALMGIPSVKAVSIGGIESHELTSGLDYQDGFIVIDGKLKRSSNIAGGIEGGITNGEPLILSCRVKPVPTTAIPQKSVDLKDNSTADSFYENADLWVIEACGVIGEAMVALVLMDSLLCRYGGDSINQVRRNYKREER